MNPNDLICKVFGMVRQALNKEMVFARDRITPIGFKFQSLSISNAVTPASAYPVAVEDGTNEIVLDNGGVLVETQIKASFKGNGAGNRFFIGAAINAGAQMSAASGANILAPIVYDQTSDLVLSSSIQYSPYSGIYLEPGSRIKPMIAGNGGGTVFYVISIKFADGRANVFS